ncbi:hypothetical protein GEMRC1_003988 [Eukaryota sp. GEM-RC1]
MSLNQNIVLNEEDPTINPTTPVPNNLMSFESYEDAVNSLQKWAGDKGFSLRTDGGNEGRGRVYLLCSCASVHRPGRVNENNDIARRRSKTRVRQCAFKLYLKLQRRTLEG